MPFFLNNIRITYCVLAPSLRNTQYVFRKSLGENFSGML